MNVRLLTFCMGCMLMACQVPLPEVPLPEQQPQDPTPVATPSLPTSQSLGLTHKRQATVYYQHPSVMGMLPMQRDIFQMENPVGQMKQVIDQLTLAPQSELGLAIWPPNTHVRELFTTSEKLIVVDFNADFIASLRVSILDEEFLVYSLVNSLLESFPEYHAVQILVGGSVVETFLGHLDIEEPLQRRYSIHNIIPEHDLREQIQVEPLLEQNQDPTN